MNTFIRLRAMAVAALSLTVSASAYAWQPQMPAASGKQPPKPPIASSEKHSQGQRILRTHLDVLTQGTPGKEFEEWGKKLLVNKGQDLTFQWYTTEPGAVGANWEVILKASPNQDVVVATGAINQVPSPGRKDIFFIEKDAFLSEKIPASPRKYSVRLTAFDAQKKPLGLAAAVSITQGPNQPAIPIDLDWTPPPPGPLEPGHPSARLIRFDPLTETKPGAIRLQLFNPGSKATDPVRVWVNDLNKVALAKEDLAVPSLKSGQEQTVTITLIPLVTKGSATLEEDREKWLARYANGVDLMVITNKPPSAYLQPHFPSVYVGKAHIPSCSNGTRDGDEVQADCSGSCPGACVDCFADAAPGFGEAAEYFSLQSQAVQEASEDALMEYRIFIKGATGKWPIEDYFNPAVVGNNVAAERIILAVARYVDTNMTYFIDDYDGWGEASAYKTITFSGGRTGKPRENSDPMRCDSLYCGDCEDHAFLRFALIRALGVGRRCVWVAEHRNSYDQGQSSCPKTEKGGGGHAYNIVYWQGKYRILDYSSYVNTHHSSNYCWDQHATDAILNDSYGKYAPSPGTQLAPTGTLHLNYPGKGTCGGPFWNWKTFYADVCP